MRPGFMKSSVIVSSIGIAALLFGGCSKSTSPLSAGSDNSNASAQLAADEVASMDADAIGQNGLSKTATTEEVAGISGTIHSYAWDSAGQCFVRSSSVTTGKGYSRTRDDTITFYNAAGLPLCNPTIDSVVYMHHTRHIVQTKGDITANVEIDVIDSLFNGGSGKFMIKNGMMSGMLDGMSIASRTINAVRRELNGHTWGFPVSGEITATFPRYSYVIVFEGNYKAQCTVTNRATSKSQPPTDLTVETY